MADDYYVNGALGMSSGVWVDPALGETEEERIVCHKKNRIT